MFRDLTYKYENPPPPDDYEFDFEDDPIYIPYHLPQRTYNLDFIRVDLDLIHRDLIGDIGNNEQNSNQTVQDNTIGNNAIHCEDNNTINSVEAELNSQVEKDSKNNASNENEEENIWLKTKIKTEPLEEGELVEVAGEEIREETTEIREKTTEIRKETTEIRTTHSDSNAPTHKKKNIAITKTPALESISKSYSRKSNSDSDDERQRKSKSSSHREKSHSKKSSKHRRKDRDPRENASHNDTNLHDRVGSKSTEFSVKQEVDSDNDDVLKRVAASIKEEVLPEKDDVDRDKAKSSKSSKKKYSDSKHRLNEDRSRDRHRDDSRRKRHDSSLSDDSRNYSNEDEGRYSDDSRDSKSNIKKDIKQELGSTAFYAPNDFYCDVCKLTLNSETTFSSHIAGKRHKKALRLKSEQDVAKSQILDIEERTYKSANRYSKPRERSHSPNDEELPSYPLAPGTERIELFHEKAKIQDACDDAKLLIVGLDYVQEIRGYEETKYFCQLCSAQCVSNSIIKHLLGYKHQLNCVRKFSSPRAYDYLKDMDKKDRRFEGDIGYELKSALKRNGRGRIQVLRDKKITRGPLEPYDLHQPGTSRQNPEPLIKKGEELAGLTVTDEDCLSRDYSDFYCKVCDAHMNNHSMWESHARGKRHAKNKKKGCEVSDGNFVEAPRGTISHLEEIIEDECGPNDFIVGLSFIKENQGENGDLYNCFLCGSVCPTMDILAHLCLRKHKVKYLEKMKANGHMNAIDEISLMPIGDSAKESLINDECDKMLEEFGPGRPVVAIPKKTF